MSADPFAHHPELRGRIVPPDRSSFRDFTADRLAVQLRELGLPTGWWRSDAEREATRQAVLDGRWGCDLWVFAYGSLMWDPAIRFTDIRHGRATNHARRFILRDTLGGRGTPDAPGLMAALDEGDGCDGLVLKVSAATLDGETEILWRREMLVPAYRPAFIKVSVNGAPLEALTFLADHDAALIDASLTREEQIQHLATGRGLLGTSEDYLRKLCAQCVALGVPDAGMDALLAGVEKAATVYRTTPCSHNAGRPAS